MDPRYPQDPPPPDHPTVALPAPTLPPTYGPSYGVYLPPQRDEEFVQDVESTRLRRSMTRWKLAFIGVLLLLLGFTFGQLLPRITIGWQLDENPPPSPRPQT